MASLVTLKEIVNLWCYSPESAAIWWQAMSLMPLGCITLLPKNIIKIGYIRSRTAKTLSLRLFRFTCGVRAFKKDCPFMVKARVNVNGIIFGCGGTIIDRHWIMTAAHCVVFDVSDGVLRLMAEVFDLFAPARIAAISAKHNQDVQEVLLSPLLIDKSATGDETLFVID
jgi:hypothetical protein